MRQTLLLAVCLTLSLPMALPASGQLRLPAIVGDSMVLQQQSTVALWGWSGPGKTVSVTPSWDHRRYAAHANGDGRWSVAIRTPAAGGPYSITFSDGKALTLKGILIGEVWVCSGQSNMEISMKGYRNQPILNANDILLKARNPSLRLFHLQRAVSNTPLDDAKGHWEASSPATAASFSAVGFQFAMALQQTLGVPVGIIETSWGGTPIEAWTDAASLRAVPGARVPPPGDTSKADAHKPTCLYNAMIHPIEGFGIKGFLWYQGENNAGHPSGYDQLMSVMVNGWRRLWKRDTLPFYFVQIAPYRYGSHRDSIPLLREAQAQAEKMIPHAGMAVTMDVGSVATIHPPDKTTVSKRLLYWALGDTYGIGGIAYRSPAYKGMQVHGNKITVTFEDAPGGLSSMGQALTAFEIAGEDRVFHPAKAAITGQGVEVSSPDVLQPVAVRYAFRDSVEGHLYNTDGLPVGPFRTDRW